MLQKQHVIYTTYLEFTKNFFITIKEAMKTKYEDSIFYHINSCARYFHVVFEQFFKELNVGISATEHLALAVIIETGNCCQRDLARIILKDRAGTGKLVNILQSKGLIKIKLTTKNNRPAKILTPTQKGIELRKKIQPTMYELRAITTAGISNDDLENTLRVLEKMQLNMVDKVKLQI